jgi:hypothetical protein
LSNCIGPKARGWIEENNDDLTAKIKKRKMFPTLLFGCRKKQVFVQEVEITLKVRMLPEDPRTDLETLKYGNHVLLVAKLNTYSLLALPIRV